MDARQQVWWHTTLANTTPALLTLESLKRGLRELKAQEAESRRDVDEARFQRAKEIQGTSRRIVRRALPEWTL